MAKYQIQTKGVIFDLHETIIKNIYEGPYKVGVQARPNLKAACEWLMNKGIKRGIITSNSERDAYDLLEEVGIAEYFNPDHVLGSLSIRHEVSYIQQEQRMPGLKGLLGKTHLVDVEHIQRVNMGFKPDPKPVQYLLQQWQIQPAEVMYVGDDMYDDQMCAVSAGVKYQNIPMLSAEPDLDMLRFLKDTVK